MGDHTDHAGGLVLPMAIELGTTVEGDVGGDVIELHSAWADERAVVPLVVDDPAAVEPGWARYVAGVVAEVRPEVGFVGTVTTTLPVGAGLSSSAALEVATALALGAGGDALDVARLCQRAEQRASGVPCGVMDQLASAAGVAGAALRIDCTTFEISPVALPAGIEVWVVHSGEDRALAGSAYAERVAACRAAEEQIGPLRGATLADAAAIADAVVRRRARHVITESARVDDLVGALRGGDTDSMGQILAASHASLRDDFEVSTPALDSLVEGLVAAPGVIGARLTGAGFGGCVVALAEPGTRLEVPNRRWHVRPADGARLTSA
jgi:galactokinase